MPIRKPLVFLFALTLLALPKSAAAAQPITEEEYKIYSLALRQIRIGDYPAQVPTLFVIGRETSGSPAVKVRRPDWIDFLKGQMGVAPDQGMVGDFIKKYI